VEFFSVESLGVVLGVDEKYLNLLFFNGLFLKFIWHF
jgi:hypothetical protein